MRLLLAHSLFGLFSLLSLCLSGSLTQAPDSPGLQVERIEKGSGWERAGLQPGDVIHSWSREASPPAFFPPARGGFRTPFDLAEMVSEEWPRGAVTVQGQRSSRNLSWQLPRGSYLDWTHLQAIPVLPADLEVLYWEGRERVAAGDYTAGAERWRSAAAIARARDEGLLGTWFLTRLARAFAEAGKWPEADSMYGEAVRSSSRREEAWAAAHLLREWGDRWVRRDRARAAEYHRQALALDQQSERPRLAAALDLLRLAGIAQRQSELKAADSLYHQALAILGQLAPESYLQIFGLQDLGGLWFYDDPSASRQWLERALELQERLDPEAPQVPSHLANLGNVAFELGDIPAAESYLDRALALQEKRRLGGVERTYVLSTRGFVALNRGDLESAEDYLHKGLLLCGKASDPVSVDSSTIILNHLGWIALRRNELETARQYFRRALTAQEKLPGVSREEAQTLDNLGIVERESGDLAAAGRYFQKSLTIYEGLSPQGIDRAALLADIGMLEFKGGNLAAAEERLQQALTLARERAPRGVRMAEILSKVASVLERRGSRAQAIEHYRQALALYAELAPGSGEEAGVLHDLGVLERRSGNRKTGVEHLCRAVDALDSQRAKLGGPEEGRGRFEASHSDLYHDCAEALLEAGQAEKAFHVVERGRARSFLRLLAERDLRFSSDLSPLVAADRRRLDAEYDRTQAALFELDATSDREKVERLQGRLRAVHRQREEIIARIRRESPRFAALQYPEPLDLAAARAALDPGTVMLSYSVGREKSYLFIVRPLGVAGPGLSIFPLAVGQKALGEGVRTFQERMRRPARSSSDLQRLIAQASSLYHLLLRPAEPLLAASDRILISPAGPLHALPFAALVRNGDYLVEWKPLHVVLSATVYAELKKAPPAAGATSTQLVAFGDPSYPRAPAVASKSITDMRVRSAVRRGLSLAPLPGARREVKDIAALFPQGQAQVYLGRDATEERAKTAGRQARILHFACHGLIDEQLPLNSSLALSIPEKLEEGRDNGLLQAWEIFERVSLDADLVTLSACDTALGKELGGEGLISLSRAFQYAGARSVLATQWAVPDRATSQLMPHFYAALRAEQSKDEALRAAQIEQLRNRRFSHPFFWAAFQLVGDWR